MQRLSSIHRRWTKSTSPRFRHGAPLFPSCRYRVFNDFVKQSPCESRRVLDISKFAQDNPGQSWALLDMTRRDGLSSWRVIFFVAAGMLNDKSGGNYVHVYVGKVMIFIKELIRFRQWHFSRPLWCYSLAHAHPQLDP